MKHHILPILLTAAAVSMPTLSAANPGAEKENIAKLQKEFLDLKFGMFLHYNMATYTNFLLNVPPTREGKIAEGAVNSLEEVGKQLRKAD